MPFSIYGEKQLDLTSQYLDNPSLNYTAKDQISGPDSSDTSDDAGRSKFSRTGCVSLPRRARGIHRFRH